MGSRPSRQTLEFYQYGCQHPFGVRQHVIVPEAQYSQPLRLQVSRPACVTSAPRVLATIDFHNKPALTAQEVANVVANGHLPRELVAAELPTAEVTPQASLCVSGIVAELLSAASWSGRALLHE